MLLLQVGFFRLILFIFVKSNCASYWLPTVMVTATFILFQVTFFFDTESPYRVIAQKSWIHIRSADGAREILGTITGTMFALIVL